MKSAPLFLLAILLLVLACAPGYAACDSPAGLSAASPAPMANIIDYVMGNRSRLITISTIGFMIGLFILLKK